MLIVFGPIFDPAGDHFDLILSQGGNTPRWRHGFVRRTRLDIRSIVLTVGKHTQIRPSGIVSVMTTADGATFVEDGFDIRCKTRTGITAFNDDIDRLDAARRRSGVPDGKRIRSGFQIRKYILAAGLPRTKLVGIGRRAACSRKGDRSVVRQALTVRSGRYGDIQR